MVRPFLVVRAVVLTMLNALLLLASHMQSDDDLQTTLSKWPFILGDVILVATALAIAILGDWQLSTWQVVSCVISVLISYLGFRTRQVIHESPSSRYLGFRTRQVLIWLLRV